MSHVRNELVIRITSYDDTLRPIHVTKSVVTAAASV